MAHHRKILPLFQKAGILSFLPLLGLFLVLQPVAEASSITVPDEAPTVQAALNASVDSVFIRGGFYPETPVVSQQVRLMAIPGNIAYPRPVLSGILIQPTITPIVLPLFAFDSLDISGHVFIRNDDVFCEIAFRHCNLGSGISDQSQYLSTAALRLEGCTVSGTAQVRVDGLCAVDSCIVHGELTVGEQDAELRVTNCRFQGAGSGFAILGSPLILSCDIINNLIDQYEFGIKVYVDAYATVSSNTVTYCSEEGISALQHGTVVTGNTVRGCGTGIVAGTVDDLRVIGNTIAGSRDFGFYGFICCTGTIGGNVIWGSGLDGMRVGGEGGLDVTVVNNSSCLNGGSGFAPSFTLIVGGTERCQVLNNVASSNSAYGIRWLTPDATKVACNDWWGNRMGNVDGRAASDEDFSLDPKFCDGAAGDFHLREGSPLINRAGCDTLVGALGMGCDTTTTSTLVMHLVAERIDDGIRIMWEVEGWPTGSEIWLERSENQVGPWSRPLTERSSQGATVIEIDHSAIPDHTYWYRLVGWESGTSDVVGSPVRIDPVVNWRFGLAGLAPNPGTGPVEIRFAVGHAAVVDIEIFDVQGRNIATVVHGLMAAGSHVARWSGSTGRGSAPSGLYLLRYRYPGGQQCRHLVRSL